MLIPTHLTGLRLYLDNFLSLQVTAMPLPFELHCEACLMHTCRALTVTVLRSSLHGVLQSDSSTTPSYIDVTVGAHFQLFELRYGFLGYVVFAGSHSALFCYHTEFHAKAAFQHNTVGVQSCLCESVLIAVYLPQLA